MSASTASVASNLGEPALNIGGALDVIVVAHSDGSLRSTDWHVVFEELGKPADVRVQINGTVLETELKLRATAPYEAASFVRADGGAAAEASALPPVSVLAALGSSKLLKPGRNEVRYSVGPEGGPCVRAFMYLWRHGTPAIIFDIDGTVTLSDLAGHVGAVFDASPTHPGVCELVCHLVARGYQIFFLSSRNLLGVASTERTRRFLFDVAVDDPSGFRMPQLPVITTKHVTTMAALMDELGGKSQAFKVGALKGIKATFGVDRGSQGGLGIDGRGGGAMIDTPRPGAVGGLFAGFGNREKDCLAYLTSGIPPERVFVIDTSSRIVGRAATFAPIVGSEGAPTADGLAAAAASKGTGGEQNGGPTRPQWQSYVAMLGSLDRLFPRCVSEHAYEQALKAHADAAARSQAPAVPAALRDGGGAATAV